MRIPSYDDLTPSIPDVRSREVLSVEALLGEWKGSEGPENRGHTTADAGNQAGSMKDPGGGSSNPGQSLYAALHDAGRASSIDRLIAIARDFSPRSERHPGGSVVLDIAGVQRLFGGAASIGEHLARAGARRVGIATTQTAALLLARAHEGVRLAGEDPAMALRDVPLAVLQQLFEDRLRMLPARAGYHEAKGGAKARRPTNAESHADIQSRFDTLQRWGLCTLGDLAALPADALSARLGAGGVALHRLAHGLDARPLVPDPAVKRFIETCELEWPIDTLEPLSFVFARLLDPLSIALERADRGGIALHLRLRLTDRTAHLRTLALPAPMRDPRVLRTLLLLDLESHPPSAAIDVVTIEIDPAPGRVVQYSLLDRPVPSPETVATLMARLGALVGETRCGSPQLVDTHQPDAWRLAPVAFKDSGSVPGHAGAGSSSPSSQVPSHLRLTLRRYRPPIPVRVVIEHGRPARVAIDRRGMPGGAVQQSAGPWRTSGGWWEEERWNRDEWDVALDGGAVCRLFQDRDTGQWFADGVYD